MKKTTLTIDARMLFASGIGTYLQNMLKRVRFEQLGLKTEIYVHSEAAAVWVHQYQPEAEVKACPVWIYGPREQLFWLKNLKGGAFWSPHFNIPWGGYEKLIVTVHDCFPLSELAHPLMRIYGGVMYGRIRQKADAILTVSEFSRRELQERAKIVGTPIQVIPNGVAPSWFTSSLPERPYPFKYFVYVGNLKRNKNLRRLLKAYGKVGPEQKLVCVGPTHQLKDYDRAALRLMQRMKDQVISADVVSDERLRAIVKHAEGLIMPSLYEGFGLPPLEAMASKVPVLVSEATSLPEVCGESALYCNAHSVEGIIEGLQKLMGLQGAERAKRLKEGYDHAAKFNWDTSAQATLEVLKSVLGQAKR